MGGWDERVGVPGERKKVFDWKSRRVSFTLNSFNSHWIICKDYNQMALVLVVLLQQMQIHEYYEALTQYYSLIMLYGL